MNIIYKLRILCSDLIWKVDVKTVWVDEVRAPIGSGRRVCVCTKGAERGRREPRGGGVVRAAPHQRRRTNHRQRRRTVTRPFRLWHDAL